MIENNIMFNATLYSMQVDGRGVSHKNDADLLRKLKVKPNLYSMFTI